MLTDVERVAWAIWTPTGQDPGAACCSTFEHVWRPVDYTHAYDVMAECTRCPAVKLCPDY
jgi:hypothetical protein